MSLPDGIKTVADRLRAARLTKQEDRVRCEVLRRFALGETPRVSTLAADCGIPRGRIRDVLRRLTAMDLLLLDTPGETILAAYPFSSIPTPHRVHLSGREVFALCAVDALGIAAMLKEDVSISSHCAHCGSAVEVQAQPERVTRYLPLETAVWFPTAGQDCDSVAQSRCPSISFFCSLDHLEDWRRAKDQPSGVVLSLLEGFEAGREIFASLLAESSAR